MSDGRHNSLLQPGSEQAWARIEADERHAPARPADTVEQRLVRGQRLSAQAALLRRSVRDEHVGDTRS